MTKKELGVRGILWPVVSVVSVGVAFVSGGCSSGSTTFDSEHALADDEVALLHEYLTGWFDSADQAASDPEGYFDIRLVMLPIWPDRTDGCWLYVEQAATTALDRPYRQRVYRVHRAESGMLHSDVFTLPGDPLAFARTWETSERLLADVSPGDLEVRDGCTIEFEPMSLDTFVGATVGRGCSSTLSGAAFATSSVRITRDLLISWDRGWNDAGEQVWGATAGGYEFVRRGDGAPPAGS